MIAAARLAARLLAAIERHGTAALILGAVVLSIAKIGGRYGIGTGIASSLEELSIYALIWMVFVGMLLADRRGQHISVELLTHALSPAANRVLARIRDALQCLAALLFAWLALRAAEFSHMIDERSVSTLAAPIWAVMAIMPLCFLLLAFVSGYRALTGTRQQDLTLEYEDLAI